MASENERWGRLEVEDEVERWLRLLSDRHRALVARHVERLETEGVHLGEPHTRQLQGKLRELRLSLGGQHFRVTYVIGKGRRIILLTVFRKESRREAREIVRAARVMAAILDEEQDDES
ncbi:MAG: type II toxin-antitoxin system RelE/ParE family toxin [Dehalococcoidia bacterium]